MNPKIIASLLLLSLISLCLATSNTKSTGTKRQGTSTAVSTLYSIVSSVLPSAGSVIPYALLFGLGALMVPALGLGLLLREGRRNEYSYGTYYRSLPTFKINSSAFFDGASDVLARVMKALDNVDMKYE